MEVLSLNKPLPLGYKFVKVLGKGAYASVCQAYQTKSGDSVAIKIMNRRHGKENKDHEIFGEIAILRFMQHPNCLKLLGVQQSPFHTYIMTEICSGGELLERVMKDGRLREKNARKVARQLFGAINYLHEDLGVMHRDLKLENVMFANKDRSSFEIRVVDFGLACVDEVAYDPVGSLQYMAPEISILRGYTCAVDCWSLGIVLHGILMGFLPYHYEDLREMEEFARGQPAPVPLFGFVNVCMYVY